MRKSPFLTAAIVFILPLFIACGKNYEKEIIGNWLAIGNNCDENGKCQSDPKVSGSIRFEKDGSMLVGGDTNGKYRISGEKIVFDLFINKQVTHGVAEIIYLKDNILLMKTILGNEKTSENDIPVLEKQDPYIIKYKKDKR